MRFLSRLVLLLVLFFPLLAQAKAKTVHVLVALCDNWHQRIYPVPYNLGKGGDPDGNLYWGAMYGVRTYFKNSKDWTLIEEMKDPTPIILRRAVFKHKKSDTFLVADAYLGKEIKTATEDLIKYSAGMNPQNIKVKSYSLNIGGGADLIAYVGHDGLMDFDIDVKTTPAPNNKKDVMVLACYSKHYFKDMIVAAKATPVLLTNGKMAPEAYVLEAAVSAWISGKNIPQGAAAAYAKYQKISNKAAMNLFK